MRRRRGLEGDRDYEFYPENLNAGINLLQRLNETIGLPNTRGIALAVLFACLVGAAPAAAQDFQLATDDYELIHDQTLDSGALSVLDNDPTLPEGRLVVSVTRTPDHGALEMRPDGTFTYIPDPGYLGTDSFDYVVELIPLQVLTIDPATSLDLDAKVTVVLGSGSDAANVPIAGSILADIGPSGTPVDNVQIVGMDVRNTSDVHLKLDFGSPFILGSLIIDVDPDSLQLGLNLPGPRVPATGVLGAFMQTGNKLGLDAVIKLNGTGLLSGRVPTDPQDIVTETDFELEGLIFNQNGTINLSLTVDSQNNFELSENVADMGITGTIVATGPYLPGASSGTETVNLNVISPAAIAETEAPGTFRLQGIYPNPVTSTATIEFVLERPAAVRVAIYDILGREVETLPVGRQQIGLNSLTWDAGRLPRGIYLLRIDSDTQTITRPVVVQ